MGDFFFHAVVWIMTHYYSWGFICRVSLFLFKTKSRRNRFGGTLFHFYLNVAT